MRDFRDRDAEGRSGVADEVAVEVEELGVVRAEVEGGGGDSVDGFMREGDEGGAAVDERRVPFFLVRGDVVGFLGDGEVYGVVF